MILIVLCILAIVLSVYLGNKKRHQAPGRIMGILLRGATRLR